MFLDLAHTKLNARRLPGERVLNCYQITSKFTAEEKYCITNQIRRAALDIAVALNDCKMESLSRTGGLLISCVRLMSKMICK